MTKPQILQPSGAGLANGVDDTTQALDFLPLFGLIPPPHPLIRIVWSSLISLL